MALLVLVVSLMPRPAAAHAALDESDPAANAILATAPATVTLRFTERLEQSYSQAALYDQSGEVVPAASFRFGDDAYTMVVDLPPDLANGTYSVLWRTLSMDDGHTAQGYLPFTIGTEADVAAIIPPAPTATTTGPPAWMAVVSRWLSYLGLATTIAVWPIWLFVLRPAISPAWQLGPGLTRRVRRLAVGGIAVALVGSLFALGVQAAGVAGAGGLLSGLTTTLGETRYGTIWLIRIGLILVYAAALLGVAWWWPRRRPLAAALALGLGALLPLPFSLIAHAAAQPAGRATAIAADALHLLAAALWAGGLIVLVGALAPTLRDLTPAGRKVVLGRAIPRFSVIALIGWGVMSLTGLYAAWLEVGNLAALRQTAYGESLTLKLLLLVPLLGLGVFNLVIVTRRLRRTADEGTASAWSGRFVGAIVAETILVALVFLVVGVLVGQAPAREVLVQAADRVTIPLEADGQQATLIISPGATGPNHYRLELGGGHDHSTAGETPVEALLRVELPSRDTGQKQIDLVQAAGSAFEGHGSEFSIAGDWEIEVIVRQRGQNDWRATASQTITTTPSAVDLPGPPPRFGPVGVAGLLLLVAGIAGVIFAWQAGRSPIRKEAAGLGAVALALGAILLLQARVAPGAAESAPGAIALAAPDAAAVVRGEALFATNCATCHGARGRGDGPAAAGLARPPADLTAAHARAHRDEDLAYWIANGIQGSEMPAFGEQFGDDEVRDLVAYLRDLQNDAALARDAPGAESCLIAPRTLEGIAALAATPIEVGATPTTMPAGEPADAEAVAGITATARELVACSNAGDILRRLALYSDARIRAAYPEGPTETLARIVATPLPVPEFDRVALLSLGDARLLADGRVSALVTIDNPLLHTHGPVTGGANPQEDSARLIFAQERGRWVIDDVQD